MRGTCTTAVSHALRVLGYLDEFAQTAEYKSVIQKEEVNLKFIFIAVLWHDCWRSQKDPTTWLDLLWYTIVESFAATRMFKKAARENGLPKGEIDRIGYAIKRHDSLFFGPETLEARLLKAVDIEDGYSEERIAFLEKKFLVDRPIKPYYVGQAKFALKFFLERESDTIYYFPFIRDKILIKRNQLIERLKVEIAEYEDLWNIKNAGKTEEFNNKFELMKKKYIKVS